MTDEADNSRIEQDRQLILDAKQRGTGAKLLAYTKLSGPGWLQSAITLGGGSLAGGLYLGILSGYHLMWLQPLAMIMGVIMLSAIGYVALSTKERPFTAINTHINPVLGWGWAIATLMANLVWCMPQYALGTAALQQNLAPELFTNDDSGKILAVAMMFVLSGIVIWFYDSGGWGIKLFEGILKILVGIVVICFFGVVIKMSVSTNDLDWAKILAGYIPNFSLFNNPSPEFAGVLSEAGQYADYWKNLIVGNQQKVMITAAATAVGINMTFLLPYSMRAKGWDKDFRGLAMFDLSTGLFVPFVLATSCVVIAAASQFHAKPAAGLLGEK
ncbi:MAG: divalent metal cation transporter, partial [Gimesia chilikensis]